MSLVRPSKLIPADALLDAAAYHSDPGLWPGEAFMVRALSLGEGGGGGGGVLIGCLP